MNNIMLCNNALFARVLKASAKSIFSLFVVLMLLSVNAQAQWSKMSLSATDIHSFAIDPSAPANMFAGTKCIGTGDGVCTAITGLYRSTNAGVNWTQVTSSLFSQKAVHVIAIAPDNTVNNKKMFISVENSGVFKSVDSGLNWTPAPIKPTGNPTFNLTQYVSQIVVTNTIGSQQVTYAVVSSSSQYQNAGGIYATVNDGVTWNQIYIGDGIQKLVVARDQPGTLYISTTTQAGIEIRKAINVNPTAISNVNFQPASSGLPSYVVDFIIDPSNSNNFYATGSDLSVNGAFGFYTSVNGGASWTVANNSILFSKIAIDSTQFPKKLYGTKNDAPSGQTQSQIYVYSSTDNGLSWIKDDFNQVAFNSASDVLVATNSSVYAGVKSGLYANLGLAGNPTGLNVRLTVQPSPTVVSAGGQITYTMTLQNLSSTQTASNFTITTATAFPVNTTKVSDSPFGACSLSANMTVSCNVSQLNPGATQNITLRVQLPSQMTQTSIPMRFTANVVNDSTPADNTDILTTVTVSANGGLTKPVANPGQNSVVAGQQAKTMTFSATPVSQSDQLTYILISPASGGVGTYGTVRFSSASNVAGTESMSPSFTYTPKANVTGQEIIRFQVRDTAGRLSDTASFTVMVTMPSTNPNVGGGTANPSGGGGAINPLLLILFGLIFLARRFK